MKENFTQNTSSIIVENISFESEGSILQGRIYRPNRQGRFPAIIFNHGYPGDEKNMDMAEEIGLHGICSLIFYYRGAWGSEGTYNFEGLEPSTKNAYDYLVSTPFVDPERIGVLGHSMGALPASAVLDSELNLKTGVFVAPAADLNHFADDVRLESFILRLIGWAERKLNYGSKEELRSSLLWARENINPIDLIKSVKTPIIVIVGSEDKLTPPELCKRFYEAKNEPKKFFLVDGADHVFKSHRIVLINLIIEWLKDTL
jgi:dipeptidyl aminopeptidase/acylaminoacyl peptidase